MSGTSIQPINHAIHSCRLTWYGLLLVLILMGFPLMSLQHIYFYGTNRAIALPLTGISIPPSLYFYATPPLVTAVYAGLHLYLLRLWAAISTAPARIDDTPLEDAISPWFVADLGLRCRAWRRKDCCCKAKPMVPAQLLLTVVLVWLGAWIVLGAFWFQSLAARDFGLSLVSALSLMVALGFGKASATYLWRAMSTSPKPRPFSWITLCRKLIVTIVVAAVFANFSYLLTEGDRRSLAALNLYNKDIVTRPNNWVPYDMARQDFFAAWCADHAPDCQKKPEPEAFRKAWHQRFSAQLTTLKRPAWSHYKQAKPDFRSATLKDAFLPAINLSRAHLQWADFSGAQMHRAYLLGAQMTFARLSDAQLQGADLTRATLHSANLFETQLQDAFLEKADLSRAFLYGVFLQRANLKAAKLNNTDLHKSHLMETNFSEAELHLAQLNQSDLTSANFGIADLLGAELIEPNLTGTDFSQAQLSWSQLIGSPDTPTSLERTDLRSSTNQWGALRYVDFSQAVIDENTDWTNTFFDSSVVVPDHMKDRIGHPCLWSQITPDSTPLSDEAFYGQWRGWLELDPEWEEKHWIRLVPSKYNDISAIPPPADCKWSADPLPGAASDN